MGNKKLPALLNSNRRLSFTITIKLKKLCKRVTKIFDPIIL